MKWLACKTFLKIPQSVSTGSYEYVLVCISVCVASSASGCEDYSGLILPDVIHLFISNGESNNTHSDTSSYLLFN